MISLFCLARAFVACLGQEGKLVGEIVVQPDPQVYTNSEGVLLMTVVMTSDIRDTHLWQATGDLLSHRAQGLGLLGPLDGAPTGVL